MVQRHRLNRSVHTVETPYGSVRVKMARLSEGQDAQNSVSYGQKGSYQEGQFEPEGDFVVRVFLLQKGFGDGVVGGGVRSESGIEFNCCKG